MPKKRQRIDPYRPDSCGFPVMYRCLPEGQQGLAKLAHFTVTAQQARVEAMRAIFSNGPHVPPPRPGTYVGLWVAGQLVMSDTAAERRSNSVFVHYARGDILVAGLGLGMILHAAMHRKDVRTITVIEHCQDVIDLVWPSVLKNCPAHVQASVICADIFDWKPPKGQTWDLIYFDIWPDLNVENLREMTILHRKFARRRNPGGQILSWEKDALSYYLRRMRA